jgi:galactonate dehydratase
MIACAGLSAIDIACHDIQAKALGVPLYKLLGGAFREAVPCYANGWYTVERTPEAIAERARQVVARGYQGFEDRSLRCRCGRTFALGTGALRSHRARGA